MHKSKVRFFFIFCYIFYYSIIDLNTIERNINTGSYLDPDQFDKDLLRLFQNNLRYYGHHSDEGQAVLYLRKNYIDRRPEYLTGLYIWIINIGQYINKVFAIIIPQPLVKLMSTLKGTSWLSMIWWEYVSCSHRTNKRRPVFQDARNTSSKTRELTTIQMQMISVYQIFQKLRKNQNPSWNWIQFEKHHQCKLKLRNRRHQSQSKQLLQSSHLRNQKSPKQRLRSHLRQHRPDLHQRRKNCKMESTIKKLMINSLD